MLICFYRHSVSIETLFKRSLRGVNIKFVLETLRLNSHFINNITHQAVFIEEAQIKFMQFIFSNIWYLFQYTLGMAG